MSCSTVSKGRACTGSELTRLWCEMEVVEGYKVALQQAGQQAQIHAVSKLSLQLRHLQVDLVQMLVHEGYQGLLHYLQSTYCI